MTGIPLIKGEGKAFALRWGNGAGGAANLTGYDVSIFDANPPAIASQLTAVMANAAIGRTEGVITDSDLIPFGRIAWFRVLLTPQSGFALLAKSSPKIWLEKS